jgi:ATP:ADP antiporter, AAA family
MVAPVRRLLDIRRGEGLLVLLAFFDIAIVVAAFLLAKPIRNSLFLTEYGPYALVYVYAAVPLVLTAFVPLYTRIAARVGIRRVTVGTLVFFALNVLAFWAAFRTYPVGDGVDPVGAGETLVWLLPGAFYVWVNCFAVVAPVQAWSFANSLFDTRQARRLFGVVGAGASLGAIAGGVMARVLVGPVGGTVNMLLVLAVLILLAAGIQLTAQMRLRRRDRVRLRRQPAPRFLESLRTIRRSRYLTLMTAMVFVVAILTQWVGFQLSLVANERYGDDPDALTAFFGTFNYAFGIIGLLLQFVLTGPALRRFGIAITILLLPIVLGFGSALILLVPVFWMVLITAGADQSLRFTVDKATYELLYLPLPQPQRGAVKSAIDIVVNRFADAIGAVLLGLATQGFFMLGGLGFGLRGTAAVNLVLAAAWAALAWQLRAEYVRTIQESIHRHRMDRERTEAAPISTLTSGVMRQRLLVGGSTEDVLATLDLLEGQSLRKFQESLRPLLAHPAAEVRRRVLAMLSARGDAEIAGPARELLRDPDISVRTEALLYLSREHGVDPLEIMEQLGDFNDFSIRAGIAAFFAASNNPEAARTLLEAMSTADGPEGARERQEAARLLPRVPASLHDLLAALILDPVRAVARQAIRSARQVQEDDLVAPLVEALARPDLADEAAEALARYGPPIVDEIAARLRDPDTPAAVKRELPNVLVRLGTAEAERVLIDSLLQPDAAVRHSIVVALNTLQAAGGARIDPAFVELVLATELAGHYRAYRQLGELRERGAHDDAAVGALGQAMDQQLERIFRLMKLLLPHTAMHDAYVGVRSGIPAIRANALEFLENVLKPDLRQVVLPLVDGHVSLEERSARAARLVRGPLDGTEHAMATLLSSGDAWLRARAIYAVGALRLHALAPALERMEPSADVPTRSAIRQALYRLASEPAPEPQAPAPAEIGMNIGAG